MLKELYVSARLSAYAATLFLLWSIAFFFCFFAIVLTVFRFVDPPTSAVMIRDHLAGARVQHEWINIEEISPNLIRSVISSEDARFCSHSGVDWIEFTHVMKVLDKDGLDEVRGASTITMQVAKNLFLSTQRSVGRKALELAITPIIELTWPKRRIMEVYLNIAQWGPGQFGIGVAARRHFQRAPRDLTETEASLLTASLPAPAVRKAGAATRYTRRIAERIRRRMQPGNVNVACVLGAG